MGVKRQWVKSTSGPDWTDVEMLMRAIGGVHSGNVEVTVSPDGIGSSGGVNVKVCLTLAVLPGSALSGAVAVERKWPCVGHAALVDHIFRLLYELDFEVGKTYKNEALWK